MRVFTLILVLSNFAVSTNYSLSDTCDIPSNSEVLSGDLKDAYYDFEYFSYLWNNSQSDYVFGRCVYNNHKKLLWVDWKNLDLKGTAKSHDTAKKSFSHKSDDKETNMSTLYYGARPHDIKLKAIHRPDEAHSLLNFRSPHSPSIRRIQANNVPIFETALQSLKDYKRELRQLRDLRSNIEANFFSYGYARLRSRSPAYKQGCL